MKPKLSIIIPSRNEEKGILKTLGALEKYVKTPHQIIIVDDSMDDTEKIIREYSRKYKGIIFIKGDRNNKSFARGLKLGFARADTNVGVVVMADLCDDPKLIDKMYLKILNGYDIICGSRYMKGGKKVGGPWLQGILSFIVCRLVNFITGIPTKDVSNAFKMYKLPLIKKVEFCLDSGVETSMEITLQAYFNGAKITELPTVWKGRIVGESKFKFQQRFPKYFRIVLWAIKNSIWR